MTRNSELSQLDAIGSTSWNPQTTAEREAVREQLGRILSSALFRNSKRFPAFLSYTVDHALTSSEPLKERTIGHEVFSREPGYDTGQDPVVRMTAAEVRKRLTQYYQQPEHQAELIVAFQPGSYVPEFLQPATNTGTPAVEVPPVDTAPPTLGRRRFTAATLSLTVVTVLMGVLAFFGARRWSEGDDNALARFWAPIVTSTSSSPVLICIGDPSPVRDQREPVQTSDTGDRLTVPEFLRTNSVRYTDAVTVASIAGELRSRGKGFRIRRPSGTELKDLRDGPVVLVGGFNNPWTLKLSDGLRFTLASDGGVPYIRDRDNPESRQWQSEAADRLIHNVNQTFGLITRTQDPATGHTVLTLSGLVFGTASAAECLLDAGCVTSAEHLAHSPSDTQNWQVVVSAEVIGLDTGAPKVVAAYTW